MSQIKDDANNITLYLIGGFIEYGYSKEYHFLPDEMFGKFASLFGYLKKYGNDKRPEYYTICTEIGIQNVTNALERSSVSFLSDRGTYIEKLYNLYVSDRLAKKVPVLDIFEESKEIFRKLFEVNMGVKGGIEDATSLCISLENSIIEAVETGDDKKGYSIGIKEIDDATGGIIAGRSMRVSAYSNTGKSSLSYFVCNNVLAQGAKVLYITLEVSKEEVRNRLISNWYGIPIWKFERKSELGNIDLSEFAQNKLHVASLSANIADIEMLVKSIKPEVLFIDYVQLIKCKGDGEYEKMTTIARELQRIIIENNVGLFDLSQVANDNMGYVKGGKIPSKGSGELVASASSVIVMQNGDFDGIIQLHLAKNRHGKKDISVEVKPNFSICDFSNVTPMDFNSKPKGKGM